MEERETCGHSACIGSVLTERCWWAVCALCGWEGGGMNGAYSDPFELALA